MAKISNKMKTENLFDRAEVLPPAKPAAVAKPTKVKTKTEVAVLPPPPPQNMLSIIAQAAANPAVDVAKMKELLAMQREIEQADQERAFNAAMHAAQSEMPRITKDKKADRFNYATLENVSIKIDPIARQNGFVLSYGTAIPTVPGNIAMYVDVMHTSGCVRRYTAPEIKPDTTGLKDGKNKTDTQGAGASISYMRRYLKLMVFDVVIAGEDIDGARARKKTAAADAGDGYITQKQVEQLVEMLEAVDCPREKFLEHMQVDKLANIEASLFQTGIDALNHFDQRRRASAKDAKA